MPSFLLSNNSIIKQLFLLVMAVSFSVSAAAQEKSITVIKQTQENTISVEYRKDNNMHCNTPLKYVVRKTGTTIKNQVFKWTIQYVPCNKQTIVKETIIFPVRKGSETVEIKKEIATRNLVSSFDKASFVVNIIEEPEFMITGPAAVQERGNAMISIQTRSSQSGVKWKWFKGSLKNYIGQGTSISQNIAATTTFYAYAEVDGFPGTPRAFTVNVVKKPDAPADFIVTGPQEITDIESATLVIKPNSTLEGVKWIWEQGNQKVGEGLSITVNPRQSTVYTVHSEYFWKKSPEKTIAIQVRVLPEPPADFEILGPSRIKEGEQTWLRIANVGINKAVKWKWYNSRTKEEAIADSLLVYPDETTTYSLMADLNGKISKRKIKIVEVTQKAISPGVVGEFKRCVSSTQPLKFTLQGGKLGTGSKNWSWYEGTCGSGRLIHRGSELTISPSKTTSYYVQPENNIAVCRAFTIEVGEMPALPTRLSTTSPACYNQQVEVEAIGYKDVNTKWHWYAKSPGSLYRSYKGEGTRIVDTVLRTTQYEIVARNSYCESSSEQKVVVQVQEQPEAPSSIYDVHNKGRHFTLRQINGKLTPGYRWVWYKDDLNGTPIGYGNEIKYKARKSNLLFVRGEGNCEPTTYTQIKFPYNKNRYKFIFINFALSSNIYLENLTDYNGQFTIGSDRIYFRLKAPLSLTLSEDKKSLNEVKLETNNSGISNYPPNTNTYYVTNGETKSEMYSASVGFLIGAKALKIYLGGGYGQRQLYWGSDIFDYTTKRKTGTAWAKHVDQFVSGALIEGGIFLRLGVFNIKGGMSMIMGQQSVKYQSFDAGLGFTFKRN